MNKVWAGIVGVAATAIVATGIYIWKYEAWIAIPSARLPVVNLLRDPASAQFRNEHLSSAGILCGEVNARNSMGGYVGFKKYISAGATLNYIEGDGVLGEWQTTDITNKLAKETEFMKMLVKWRNEGLDIPKYSEKQLDEMATKIFFESKWRDLCEMPQA